MQRVLSSTHGLELERAPPGGGPGRLAEGLIINTIKGDGCWNQTMTTNKDNNKDFSIPFLVPCLPHSGHGKLQLTQTG